MKIEFKLPNFGNVEEKMKYRKMLKSLGFNITEIERIVPIPVGVSRCLVGLSESNEHQGVE